MHIHEEDSFPDESFQSGVIAKHLVHDDEEHRSHPVAGPQRVVVCHISVDKTHQ